MATLKADLRNLNATLRDFTDRVEKSFDGFTRELKRITDLAAKSQVNEQRINALEERVDGVEKELSSKVDNIQEQISWGVKIIVGGVLVALLGLVIKSSI